jgi:hypothetical protein
MFYAHVDGARVLDVQEDATLDDYKARFSHFVNGDWASHAWKEVPEGTSHWAIDNGDGTYTKVPASVGPVSPVVFDLAEITAFLIAFLDPADSVSGLAKLRKIMEDSEAVSGTSNNSLICREFRDWFYSTLRFTRAELDLRLAALVGGSVITAEQRTAINTSWPEA